MGISIWQSRTAFHRQRLVEDLNPLNPALREAFAPLEQLSGGNDQAMWAMTEKLATVQASTLGLNDTFIVCIWVAVPVLFMAMFIPAKLGPKPPNESDAG